MAACDPPTSRQLGYLRSLAERTGQTFAYPKTRRDAGREIERLKRAPASSRVERRLDRQAVVGERRAELDGARVRDDEITGYGSGARWRGRS